MSSPFEEKAPLTTSEGHPHLIGSRCGGGDGGAVAALVQSTMSATAEQRQPAHTVVTCGTRATYFVEAENISVHRYGLAMSARAHLRAIKMWSVVVVAAGDHLSTTDKDGTEDKVHRALGSRIEALREEH